VHDKLFYVFLYVLSLPGFLGFNFQNVFLLVSCKKLTESLCCHVSDGKEKELAGMWHNGDN